MDTIIVGAGVGVGVGVVVGVVVGEVVVVVDSGLVSLVVVSVMIVLSIGF